MNRTYEVWTVEWPERVTEVRAPSSGNARYRRWLDLREPYPDIPLTSMRSRVVDRLPREKPGFRECMERRGLPGLRVGETVRLRSGDVGEVVGHNDSANVDVLVGGVVWNVHPADVLP